MLLDVGLEVLLITTTLILHRLVTLASRDPEDRWVATDLKGARNEVVGGIDLGETNLAAFNVVCLSKLLPGRKKSLAVTAPWGISSDESISLSLGDNFVESLTNDNFNFTRLKRSGNRLTLDVLLSLAVNKELGEGLDIVLLERISVDLTLVELLTVDDSNLIFLVLAKVHLLEVVVVVVSSNKVKLALELLGDGADTVEDVAETSRIILSADLAIDEKDGKRAIAIPGVLVIDTSKRERGLLDPLTELISVVLTVVDDLLIFLIKAAVGNNLVSVLVGGRGDTKDIVLTKSVCNLLENFTNLGVFLGVSDKLDIVLAGDELLESLSVLKRLGSGASLSTHVLYDTIGLTRTLVLGLLTLVEDVESRITVDVETLSEILFFFTVNLSKDDTLLVESFSSLDVFRSKVLAVTTPWGKELNEDCFSLIHNLIKVVFLKDNNLAVLSYTKSGKSHNCENKECLIHSLLFSH